MKVVADVFLGIGLRVETTFESDVVPREGDTVALNCDGFDIGQHRVSSATWQLDMTKGDDGASATGELSYRIKVDRLEGGE